MRKLLFGLLLSVMVLPVSAQETNLANVAADIAALTSGGTVTISSAATGTITSTITVSNPNVTVHCNSPSAVFTRASSQSFNMFQVTAAGTGFTLDGCSINMNGGSGDAILWNSGTSNGTATNNVIVGSDGHSGLQANGLATGLFQNNTITNGNMFCQGNSHDIQFLGNTVTNVTSSTMVCHSTTSGQTVYNLTFKGNHMNCQGTFCLEVGSFGGGQPTGIVVGGNSMGDGNDATQIGVGAGGYSFGATIGVLMLNNTFSPGAFTPSIAAIEFAPSTVNSGVTQLGCSGGLVSNNTIAGNMSLNEASSVEVASNAFTMGYGKQIWYLGGSAGRSTNSNNLHNNTLTCTSQCSTALGTHPIIWLQANNAAEQVKFNIFNQNLITGSGSGNSETGMYGEDDSGIMDANQVINDDFHSMLNGYWFNNAPQAEVVYVAGNTQTSVTTLQHAPGTNVTYTAMSVPVVVVTISPLSYDFGSANVSIPAALHDFTITNISSASTSLSTIDFTGAAAADYSKTTTCGPLPATLAAGASCTVHGTFTPSVIGSRPASLRVIETKGSHLSSLTGTGVGTSQTLVVNLTGGVGATGAVTLQGIINIF